MHEILIHGVFEEATLETLFSKGVRQIGFDLRPRSSELITFKQLKYLLGRHKFSKKILMFADEKPEVILSSLDLLKDFGRDFLLEFRDQQTAAWYRQLNYPFLWMFHPYADWEGILESDMLMGILLPLEWRSHYQALPRLWELIEQRHLDVYLHANNFAEAEELKNNNSVSLSLDLAGEFLNGPRSIDQERLSNHLLWR
jgi:hypothetical protein